MAKEIFGRGRRKSHDEQGNQGVGDFRLINILQLSSIYFVFSITFALSFFSIHFLSTTFTPEKKIVKKKKTKEFTAIRKRNSPKNERNEYKNT